MEKKNLKWYEAPQMEVVEMETAVSLLTGSDPETKPGDGSTDDSYDPFG